MAIASTSLMNMSVATDTAPSNLTLLMPKLQFRFRVGFINFGVSNETSVLTRQVSDVTRPNLSFAEIPLQIYNSTVKLAGKHTWADITVNLRDDASGQVSTLVGQQLQKQLNFMEQASAPSGIDYKFRLEYDILDGGNGQITPTVLEQWLLEGCFLSSVDYGEMAYNSNDPVIKSS